MRDAANLVWKHSAVLHHQTPDALLETYQREREPHVRAIVELAVGFGRLICTTDVAVAAARDAQMLADHHDEANAPQGTPALVGGDAIGPGGGGLSAQPWVEGQRLDDVVGPRFALITREPLSVDDTDRIWWSDRATILDAQTYPELDQLLGGHECIVVRPDRYVYATGAVGDITITAKATLSV